jgi:hypothetical protein
MVDIAERVARRYEAALVDPLAPEDAEAYLEEALRRVRRYGDRTIRIAKRPSPARNPEAYDLRWAIDLGHGAVHVTVQVSYMARRGVHLQVSEQRQGVLRRLVNEKFKNARQYKLMISACLAEYYDRKAGPR